MAPIGSLPQPTKRQTFTRKTPAQTVSTFSLNRDFIGLGRTKGGIYTIGLFLGIKVLSST